MKLMKVQLSGGEGKFGIQYNLEESPEHLKAVCPHLRSTTVSVVLPNGETLTGKVVCFSQDTFIKRMGRFTALRKIISADNEQAIKKAFQIAKVAEQERGLPFSRDEIEQEAKKYYKLNRVDRRTIFQLICPEFYRNTPERILQREKALYERLNKKFSSTKVAEQSKVFV